MLHLTEEHVRAFLGQVEYLTGARDPQRPPDEQAREARLAVANAVAALAAAVAVHARTRQ